MIQCRLPLKFENVIDDVPWKREGIPGTSTKYDTSNKWGKKITNISSTKKNRIHSDEQLLKWINEKPYHGSFIFGIEERTFAMVWDYENNAKWGGSEIIEHILEAPEIACYINSPQIRYLAELVAQSIVQWLGTNCGNEFINRVRKISKEKCNELKQKADKIVDIYRLSEMRKSYLEKINSIAEKEKEINALKMEINSIEKDFPRKMEEKLEEERLDNLKRSRNIVCLSREIDLGGE